eukprot:EG_transcript_59395
MASLATTAAWHFNSAVPAFFASSKARCASSKARCSASATLRCASNNSSNSLCARPSDSFLRDFCCFAFASNRATAALSAGSCIPFFGVILSWHFGVVALCN